MTIQEEEIKDLCIEGLGTDGGHHKQWFLEEILKKLGYKLEDIAKEICNRQAKADKEDPEEYWDEYSYDGVFWEKGIAP